MTVIHTSCSAFLTSHCITGTPDILGQDVLILGMVWNPCTVELSQIFRTTLILPNYNIILALSVHFAMNYNCLALTNTKQKTAE